MRFSRTITTIVFLDIKGRTYDLLILLAMRISIYLYPSTYLNIKYSADIRTILLHTTRYIEKRTRMYRSQPHPNHSL